MHTHSKSMVKLLMLALIISQTNALADGVTHSQQITKDSNGNVTTIGTTTGPGFKFSVGITQSKEEHEKSSKNKEELINALSTCSPFQKSIPHPLVQGFTAKEEVHGISDQKCKYTQTMPNGGLLSCSFTEQQRNEFKANGMSSLQSLMQDESTCKITGYNF